MDYVPVRVFAYLFWNKHVDIVMCGLESMWGIEDEQTLTERMGRNG